MHQNSSDLAAVEISITEAERNIEKLNALKRLRKNTDFIALIEIGFLRDEASQVVLAKAEPGLQAPEQQNTLDNMIHAIGYFRQYLNKILQFGQDSERAIKEHRKTREEIMAETH